MSKTALKMANIIKDFPGVRALDNVNFEANYGEVLALIGENGAGKSTLMKVLSGVWSAGSYQGEIYIDGLLKKFHNTKQAEDNGVGIIYQELNLIPELTVAENIFLDRQPTDSFGKINWNKVYSDTQNLLDQLNIANVRPGDITGDLTVGNQQMIEIAKALSLNARIIVFDEPTSALTDKEVSILFKTIHKLKSENVCIIYISHKMDELKQIVDKISVLRDGKTIGEVTPLKDITMDEIINKMVGRDIKEKYPKVKFTRGKKTLEVKNFSVDHPFIAGEKIVRGVSFEAYQGEILGIAGLMGSGRTELVTGLFGAFPDDCSGEIYIEGKKLKINSPADAINHGIGLVTEDRKTLGLILSQSVKNNMTLSSLETFSKAGIINESKERQLATDFLKKLNIKTPSLDVDIAALSGGNQQKVILAKWLNTHPKILIMDEPTRGIDVGAKTEIYKLMNELVKEGVTVVMISSELPEIMGMSDRIIVMSEGKKVAELSREESSQELIMQYCTGNISKNVKEVSK